MDIELIQIETLAKEMLRRCMAEEEPGEILNWLSGMLVHVGGDTTGNAVMTWEESFEFVDRMIAEYERIAALPESERKLLSWPWDSWRRLIDPLDAGMLGVITAADGTGKTIYAESITEYWAENKNHVVFIHYELNRKLMMLRRTSRHTGILARSIKEGRLFPEEKQKIAEAQGRLKSWDGFIDYIHTPGWSMEKTIGELNNINADRKVDAVVLDYLEKVAASTRQLKLFGSNVYQREADNVEQLKNFAESTGIPVLMVTQMNKLGKETSFEKVDRTGIRGAGEKSDKANLVVMLNRERTVEGYSKTVNVLVDKNTMGGTGSFDQIMQPEYYRVADKFDPEF